MRHAFAAICHQAFTRLKFAGCLISAIVFLSGCAYRPDVVRTPLRDVVKLPKSIQNIPIALLEVASIPQEMPDGAETRLISFPDEIMVRKGDAWVFKPSRTVVLISDVLLLGLRHAGFTIESYPTLYEAHKTGARIGIVGTLTTGEVRMPYSAFSLTGKEALAIAELVVALVDLEKGQIIWSGPLKCMVRDEVARFGTRIFTPEKDAATETGEMGVHSLRSLITQCYYHLSMDLALHLADAVRRKPL